MSGVITGGRFTVKWTNVSAPSISVTSTWARIVRSGSGPATWAASSELGRIPIDQLLIHLASRCPGCEASARWSTLTLNPPAVTAQI